MYGRVAEDRKDLKNRAKHEAATTMMKALLHRGVRRVLVYDASFRPVIKYAGGELRSPRDPDVWKKLEEG